MALEQFRRILNFVGKHPRKSDLHDLTHTGIAKLDESLRSELVGLLAAPPPVNLVMQSLLLFDALPAHEVWKEKLIGVELLMDAVGSTLWHQSQKQLTAAGFGLWTR